MAAATLPAACTPLKVNWFLFGAEETRSIRKHHHEIDILAKYARRVGKSQVQIVGDENPGDEGWGFRAVNFLHNGQTVTVRTIFDIQYHYS